MTEPPHASQLASTDPVTGEELLVLWELVKTTHLAARIFRDLFATVGLTPTQFGILACLADGDDFTKTQLAHALMIRPQSIDPLVEALIRNGLVERDRPARRGRAAGIRITPDGLDRLARVRPEVSRANAPDKLGIPADQIPELVSQLRTTRNQIHGLND